jgi:hypothetical protein
VWSCAGIVALGRGIWRASWLPGPGARNPTRTGMMDGELHRRHVSSLESRKQKQRDRCSAGKSGTAGRATSGGSRYCEQHPRAPCRPSGRESGWGNSFRSVVSHGWVSFRAGRVVPVVGSLFPAVLVPPVALYGSSMGSGHFPQGIGRPRGSWGGSVSVCCFCLFWGEVSAEC